MSEIGKIDKPEVTKFEKKKKIYFVRNLYLPQNATDKYKEIFGRYWTEVEEHLERLQSAGKISKIFCESIYMSGEESMKVISAMNIRLEHLVQKIIDAGGNLIPLENKDVFGAYIDWNNCLMIVRTKNVHEKIHEFLNGAIKERFDHIKSVLMENISDDEAAMLVMRDEDRKHLIVPDDIEIFLVTPPAYDDLLQFIRDRDSGKEFWRTG